MKKLISIAASVSVVALMLLNTNCNNDNAVAPANSNTARVQNGTEASNIIYSDWITISNWTALTNSIGYMYHRTTISNISKLDQNMLNQGLILVYARLGGATGSVSQLPFKRAWDRSNGRLYYENWDYTANLNQLTVSIDPEQAGYMPPVGAQVRYIMTPGVIPGARKAATINYSDYNAVKTAYNLPD